ncbi:hypothetical protein ES703_71238 [subsurface metagenome]
MSHSPALDSPVMKLISDNIDGAIILDVANGLGNWGYQIRTKKKGNPIVIGIDIWTPYVEKVNQMNIYDELIICDVRNPPLRSRSIDIVIACEILEHISLDETDRLLNELESLHRNIIILTTPLGFYEQGIVEDNPYEQHISGWSEKELKERNYKTKIVYRNKLPIDLQFLLNLRRIAIKWLLGMTSTNHLIIAWKKFEMRAAN